MPITDTPWAATWDRWQREGMPKGATMHEYFGTDWVATIFPNTSPRFPGELVEETDEWTIVKSEWGVTLKNWKNHGGVPEFLDFTIVDPESWAVAKERMTPTRDRVDWNHLKREYPKWVNGGAWVQGHLWFGFDVTHSWAMGTDRVLLAMMDNPEWLKEVFAHELKMSLDLMQMVLDEGYAIDSVTWPDDMGYRGTQFFSRKTYQEILKPFHKQACDWAHMRGLKVHLHSCGNILPFMEDLLEIGVDILNPIEVKAGMDPLRVKREFGDKLTLHGGLNAVLFEDMTKMREAMEELVPSLKAGGGYWLSSDHSVPDSVSLDEFREFIELAKRVGSFG